MSGAESQRGRRKKSIGRLVRVAKDDGKPLGSYAGKRHHTRYATGLRLEITLDPNNPEDVSPVVMHNVSEGGFAFWYRRQLLQYTLVHLRECSGKTAGEWLPAQVRHCTRGLLGFLVGAEFQDVDTTAQESQSAFEGVPRVRQPADSKAEHLRRIVRRQLASKR